jgi:type IV secretion system protein VirB4
MQHVARLVKGNFSLDTKDRRLEVLASYLPQGKDNHLAIRLKRWYGAGDLAWLFDNTQDQFPMHIRTIGFDLTHILDEPIARAAALRYMFHRIEGMIDGTPISITMDEGWKGLEDEYVSQKVFDWEKTIRKRNGFFTFGSQSARDLSETRIGKTIIEQSPTQIFYPNQDADYASYCEAFSLTHKEFDLVKNVLDPSSRAFLIKHGRDSIVAKLDLHGMGDALAVLSGREETVRLLDQIRKEVGDDPEHWLPVFHQRRKHA